MFLISILLSIFMIIFRLALKVVTFTGAWLSFLFLYVMDKYIMPFILGEKVNMLNFPSFYPIYKKTMFFIMITIMVVITTRNIIKLFNPNFSLLRFLKSIFKKREKVSKISEQEMIEKLLSRAKY